MPKDNMFRERINLDGGLIASVYCWYDDGVEREWCWNIWKPYPDRPNCVVERHGGKRGYVSHERARIDAMRAAERLCLEEEEGNDDHD